VTDEVLKALGLDRARIAALREVPVAKLLDAQRAAMMAVAKPTDPTPVYRMVRDGKLLTTDPPAGVAAGIAKGIDVMIGTTRDEVHAFFIGNDAIANIDRAGMAKALAPAAGTRAETIVDAYAKRLPGAAPPALFAALQTDAMFRLPSLRFAEAQGKHARAWLYRFDWQPTRDAPYGAALHRAALRVRQFRRLGCRTRAADDAEGRRPRGDAAALAADDRRLGGLRAERRSPPRGDSEMGALVAREPSFAAVRRGDAGGHGRGRRDRSDLEVSCAQT
jgi:hypothetical protein